MTRRGATAAGLPHDLAAAIDRAVVQHGGGNQDALDLAQMCRRALDEMRCASRPGTATAERTAKPRHRRLEELSGYERGHPLGPGSWPAISAALSAAADSGGASTRDLASRAKLRAADAETVADDLRSVGLLVVDPGVSGAAERYRLPEALVSNFNGGGG